MAAPLKISARFELDANPGKQGAAAASAAVDGIGAAAERNTGKLQALINATTGIGTGPANGNIREWTGALAMQGRSLDELRAKYNPLFATISHYKAALTEIRTLHAQGVLSTNEMTAAIQRHRQAALASIDAIKGRGAALRAEAANSGVAARAGGGSFQTANIAAQFQDIAVTSAMGMSPLQIALQQGTQLSSVLTTMGTGRQVVAGLGAAFASLVSTTSLVTIGLTAAGAALIQYFSSFDWGSGKSEAVLAREAELIAAVAQQWGDALPALKAYADERAALEKASQTSEAIAAAKSATWDPLRAEMSDAAASIADVLQRVRDYGLDLAPLGEIKKSFADLQGGVEAGNASADDAKRVFEALMASFRSTGDPVTEALAKRFLALADAIAKAAGTARGLDIDRTIAQISRYPTRGAYPGVRRSADGPIIQADPELPMVGPRVERRPLIELDGLPGARRQDGAAERGWRLDETMAQQRLEASLIGATIGEQERLRMQHRLTAEAKAEAAREGAEVDAAELARIRALSAEYGRLAEQMTARRALDGQERDIEALRTRLALVGQSEAVRTRVLAQLEAERRLREMGLALGSREAEQYRRNAELLARQTEELRRQEAAWSKVRGTAEGTIDTLLDGLVDGDLRGSLSAVLKDWSRTILQLGVANPLKNSALGTNHETLADIGGLGGMLDRLFGGGMSTASMAVTAATVSVNGGIAGGIGTGGAGFSPTTTLGELLGAGGAAANDNTLGSSPGGMEAYRSAISAIESGGRYDALGPITRSGDRAYGKYQMMGNNIGPWSRDALGRSISAQEFLRSPALQDRIFDHRFGGYVDRYGASGAAQAWFGGPGSVGRGGNGADILGTTGKDYVARFTAELDKAQGSLDDFGGGLKEMGSGLNKFGSELSGISLNGAGGGGGGGFNWASLFSPSFTPNTTLGSFLINGFSAGGPTGGSNPSRVAGLVHEAEYVFDAASTARIGVDTLDAIRRGALGGWRDGGMASVGGSGRRVIPAPQPLPAHAAGGAEARGRAGIDVRISFDRNWNPQAQVREIAAEEAGAAARSHVRAGLEGFNRVLPDRVREIQANPRRR